MVLPTFSMPVCGRVVLADCFDFMLVSEELGVNKPDPRIFTPPWRACRKSRRAMY